MCALAHILENAGIPTVVISLIRLHSEIIRPPRALFVPFELGRPLGDPGDISGQMDVLRAALELLIDPGPGPVLCDFPDPPVRPVSWQPPFDLLDTLEQELATVLQAYARAVQTSGRTTFGNAGLSPSEVTAMFQQLCQGQGDGLSSKLVRFAIDDLKTLYFEAACNGETGLPSGVLNDWFWHRTFAGKSIATLRAEFLASENKGRKMIANFMVPGEWVDKLGL